MMTNNQLNRMNHNLNINNQTFDDVPDYLREFLAYSLTIAGKSLKTVNAYYYELRMFLRYFKLYFNLTPPDTEFNKIDTKDMSIEVIQRIKLSNLYDFFTYVNLERDNTARTRARKVSCLRSFYKYLETRARLITENPINDMDMPRIGSSLPRYLELDASIKLLECIDNKRDYAMITILLNCGLRISELIGISISDIKGDKLIVKGKGNKERTVYLNDACLFAIDSYVSERETEKTHDKNALFLNCQGHRMGVRGAQLIVKKYLSKAGLDTDKYSAHKLRHTAATLMYKYGNVDLRTLQEILGHVSLQTTQIYTHVDNETQRNAVKSNPLSRIKK